MTTSKVEIDFKGWAHCRLATNPDPYNEPIGISSTSFSLPGEPYLDRGIRFQPVANMVRKPGPDIGVKVIEVRYDGVPYEEVGDDGKPKAHKLVGSPVHLLEDPSMATKFNPNAGLPKFEGRNNIIERDSGESEPIDPFNLLIGSTSAKIKLRRRAYWDPTKIDMTLLQALEKKPDVVKKLRVGNKIGTSQFGEVGIDLLCISGIVTENCKPKGFNPEKKAREHIETQKDNICDEIKKLRGTTDTQQLFNLKKRLVVLSRQGRWMDLRAQALYSGREYCFSLNELSPTVDCEYPTGNLPAIVNRGSHWTVSFWVGCWDADALAVFVNGTLSIK